MELIIYKNIPCPVLLKEEPDTFLILFKDEQKWIFECSLGYGEIKKDEYGICYLFNDKTHRENGPAVEHPNGDKYWFQNGSIHREKDPAIEYSNGNKYWYKNGKLHREDGPAMEHKNGDKFWYQNGKCHREDGPAKEYFDEGKYWYLDGIEYFEKEFKNLICKKPIIKK